MNNIDLCYNEHICVTLTLIRSFKDQWPVGWFGLLLFILSNWNRFAVGLLLVLGLTGLCGAAPPLRLIISDSIPPPYLLAGTIAAAGQATDLCRVVARRLGYDPVLSVVPPKRVPEMMKSREADMLCHVSPDWYAAPMDLDFGAPLYEVRNVFIGPADQPDICDGCQPSGEVVTVIGHIYGSAANHAFADGTAHRRDVRTEEGVYMTVQRGHATLGILSEQTFRFLAVAGSGLSVKGVSARFPVTIGVAKGGVIKAADLLRVTTELARGDAVPSQ